MTDISTLEALESLHGDLLAVQEGRPSGLDFADGSPVLEIFEREFDKFWDRPPRSDASRSAVKSGTRVYILTKHFVPCGANERGVLQARSLSATSNILSTMSFNSLPLFCRTKPTSTRLSPPSASWMPRRTNKCSAGRSSSAD